MEVVQTEQRISELSAQDCQASFDVTNRWQGHPAQTSYFTGGK